MQDKEKQITRKKDLTLNFFKGVGWNYNNKLS